MISYPSRQRFKKGLKYFNIARNKVRKIYGNGTNTDNFTLDPNRIPIKDWQNYTYTPQTNVNY